MSPICLTSHVGAGSAEHCLFGAARSKAITSWDVTSSNRPSCGTLLWFIVAAGACMVLVLIPSTLSVQNLTKSEAECSPTEVDAGCNNVPSRRHRLRESGQLSIAAFQQLKWVAETQIVAAWTGDASHGTLFRFLCDDMPSLVVVLQP